MYSCGHVDSVDRVDTVDHIVHMVHTVHTVHTVYTGLRFNTITSSNFVTWVFLAKPKDSNHDNEHCDADRYDMCHEFFLRVVNNVFDSDYKVNLTK